jgi:putative ABC transport system permease protein
MTTLKIAFRNIFRNGRRSLMTVLAISVGGIAVLLFGGYVTAVILGFQTQTVQRVGHLAVFRAGYFDFGSGKPGAYSIGDYKAVMTLIADDPELGPRIAVATPTVRLFGIAGNFVSGASRTYFATGVVPTDQRRMLQWNEYGMRMLRRPETGLRDGDTEGGVIGVGLARILNLCDALEIASCPRPPLDEPGSTAEAVPRNAAIADLQAIAAEDQATTAEPRQEARPRIDLLAATAGGAPNVVSFYVNRAEAQPVRELDDAYVGMHLALAQKLLFGRGEPRVTSITLQLHRTQDMALARARLVRLFTERGLPLEVRDFTELQPMYLQVLGLFGTIFSFIALIMAVIVVFTVVNTMSMSVMERINEIGTVRALGVRRSGVRRQFVAEGWILGMIGATAGVMAALVISVAVNAAHLTWIPPISSYPAPLSVLVGSNIPLLAGCWIGLVLIATLASLMPASRAARMQVVDALRHV